jgi:hypothetical protein
MSNGKNNGYGWLQFLFATSIAVAGAVAWIEARVGDEAEIRREADIRIEQKIDANQQRIEDKLDIIIRESR